MILPLQNDLIDRMAHGFEEISRYCVSKKLITFEFRRSLFLKTSSDKEKMEDLFAELYHTGDAGYHTFVNILEENWRWPHAFGIATRQIKQAFDALPAHMVPVARGPQPSHFSLPSGGEINYWEEVSSSIHTLKIVTSMEQNSMNVTLKLSRFCIANSALST